ncbi:phospholipase A and acyltransferase 4-like isoform X3 [Odontesthes bonariensis]|uniref:phospholipase A and acyltransferase 4-like isoform X3 n=1 Tax=Odontesthes bonariensis TaxID=219752 RepID=UPI003F5894E5
MAPTLFDSDAKPGDLIEIFRGTYKHWAVFIGGNEVVHLIPPTPRGGDFSDLLTLLDSGKAQVQTAAVIGGVATAGVAVAILGAALFSAFLKDDNKRDNPK